MASAPAEGSTLTPDTLALIARSRPSLDASSTAPLDINTALFPDFTFTPADTTTIAHWLDRSHDFVPSFSQELNTHLATRTTILGAKPSIADIAAFAVLSPHVAQWSKEERTGAEGLHHVVRFVDFVQNSVQYKLALDEGDERIKRVEIDPSDVAVPLKPRDAKAEKEKRKKEAAAAAATAATAGGGAAAAAATTTEGGNDGSTAMKKAKEVKEKVKDKVKEATAAVEDKQKKSKEAKAKKNETPTASAKTPSPGMVDIRIGHILKAEQHPDADKLYVSTIAMGDPAGADNTSTLNDTVVRTVCSGLAGLIPLEQMQDRLVVVVANLKPVSMRGVKSCAMVLCASPRAADAADESGGHGMVELVVPPEGAKAGDRCWFEGWEEAVPEKQLNPKKKVFETVAPGFVTTYGKEVAFERGRVEVLREGTGDGDGRKAVALLKCSSGGCSVPSLADAAVR